MPTGIAEFDTLSKEVTELKVSVAGMKPYVEQIPQINKSLQTLAEIMPRLEMNMEDHKHIHQRLDTNEKNVNELFTRQRSLELEHAQCSAMMELNERQEKVDTFWEQVQKAAIPIVVAAVLAFIGWMIMTHIPDFMKARSATKAAISKEG